MESSIATEQDIDDAYYIQEYPLWKETQYLDSVVDAALEIYQLEEGSEADIDELKLIREFPYTWKGLGKPQSQGGGWQPKFKVISSPVGPVGLKN